jgi:hypothetical protein
MEVVAGKYTILYICRPPNLKLISIN